MLREQGDVAVAFVKDRVRVTRGYNLCALLVTLACSLVAIDAFGQGVPNIDWAPDCRNADGDTAAWREPIDKWVKSQQQHHPFLRAMDLPETLCVEVQNRAQVADYIDHILDETTHQTLDAQETILRAFGVLPTKKSYAQILKELLVREVSGYYEPEDQKLYVVAERVEELDASVVIHELQHLAQDIAWDLSALLRPHWHQSDVLNARSALVEGDAMLTLVSTLNRGNPSYLMDKRMDAMRAGAEKVNLTLIDRYPRFVLDSVTMPYIDGLDFARQIYAYDQWFGLNDVFDDPPMSTAQILYPERYRNKEEPILLHYALSPKESGTRRYSDVWGMMTLRHLFRAMTAPDRAVRAEEQEEIERVTQGWIGDRIELWHHRRQKHQRMTWLIAMSDADQARALFDWMTEAWTTSRSTQWTCAEGVNGAHCGSLDENVGTLLEQWGEYVLWVQVEHRDASALEAELLGTADDVFRTLRRTAYPNMWRHHTLANVPAHDPAAGDPPL